MRSRAELEAERTTDPTRLRALAEHRSKTVRLTVASNGFADDRAIELLLHDEDPRIQLGAAGNNLARRPTLHELVFSSADPQIRGAVAYAQSFDLALSYDMQKVLAAEDLVETRGRIAETTNYSDLFDALLEDREPRVRGMCAANPRISRDQMERLVTDRNRIVRGYAAVFGLLYPDDEQLIRLAVDRAAAVRWHVLFRVDRPRAAIELIAQDSDETNRLHADSALADPRALMSDQVCEAVRAERAQAALVGPFEPTPRYRRFGGACSL